MDYAEKLSDRFNRYIVECKYSTCRKLHIWSTRFNRYIVECKCGTAKLKELIADTDLIDT